MHLSRTVGYASLLASLVAAVCGCSKPEPSNNTGAETTQKASAATASESGGKVFTCELGSEELVSRTLALVLLEQVVTHDRERAVAWLNLADAKWGHQDSAPHEGAGAAYREYIAIMTNRGREGSIPTRAWQRAGLVKPES